MKREGHNLMQLPAPEFSLKHLLQVTGGLVAAVWIQLPEATQTLLIFMGLDMLSGILAGAKLKRLSSDTMYVGLLKKCLVLILVAAGHQLQGPGPHGVQPGNRYCLGVCGIRIPEHYRERRARWGSVPASDNAAS